MSVGVFTCVFVVLFFFSSSLVADGDGSRLFFFSFGKGSRRRVFGSMAPQRRFVSAASFSTPSSAVTFVT